MLSFVLGVAILQLGVVHFVRSANAKVESLRLLLKMGATPMEQNRFSAEVVFGVNDTSDRGIFETIQVSIEADKIRRIYFGSVQSMDLNKLSTLADAINTLRNVCVLEFSEGVLVREEITSLRQLLPSVRVEVIHNSESGGGKSVLHQFFEETSVTLE